MTRAQPYGEYKESEVEWLGPIPTQWELRRLKSVVALQTDRAVQQTNPVALENIQGWTGRFLPSDSEFTADGTKFSSGDVLFGKLRPYLAKSWLADCDGEAVGDFHVLRPSLGLSSRFLQYITLSPEFISMVDGSTFGAKMPRASWDFIGELRYPMPDRATQDLVASFLDRETAQIDDLIGKQERLIELLAEKREGVVAQAVTNGIDPDAPTQPSGVPWLGDIPSHWNMSRLSWESNGIGDGLHGTPEYSDDGLIPFINGTNLLGGKIRITNSTQFVDENQLSAADLALGESTVLMSINGTVGNCAVLGKHRVMLSKSAAYVNCSDSLNIHFLAHFLRSPHSRNYFQSASGGTTIANLSLATLRGIPLPVPPNYEQRNIARWIDDQVEKIDDLIAKNRRAVTLLRERRSSLISAAVTGKIDVREGVA